MARGKRDPRVAVAVRLSPDGLKKVDELAEREDRTRSEMIRRMLAYAAQNMPKGWKP
jgi:predicted transcriptional regulator